MSRRGIEMSLAQVRAHQRKHGFEADRASELSGQVNIAAGRLGSGGEAPASSKRSKLTRKDRMTRPEREMALILEAQKRRGEIVEWRFEGISLAWGVDPATGNAQRYKGDFWVWVDFLHDEFAGNPDHLPIKIIEVKGARIWPKDMIRFRGCRSDWPMFRFEMWQLAQGTWSRVE